MTDDIHHPANTENRSDSQDHQHAREACQHAAGALATGDLSHARTLLDEATAAVERTQHDDNGRAYRETAYDCHD